MGRVQLGSGGRRALLVGGGIAALAAAAVAIGRPAPGGADGGAAGGPAAGPRRVEVDLVRAGALEQVDVLHGVTTAGDRGRLSFTTGGRVVARPAALGERVEAGAVLARLDAKPLRNALAAAEAQVVELAAREAQLVRDRARVDALRASGATPEQQAERIGTELDAVRALARAAVARRDEARRVLSEAALVAPYAGVVTAVGVEAGEQVAPGQPVVELVGEGAVEVEVEAPEAVAERIAPGQAVEVELPARAKVVPGRVRSVSRSGRGRGGLFPVVVTLEGAAADAVTAGLSARVVLRHREEDALVLPLRAVVDPTGQRPTVFRVAEGRAHRTRVALGPFSEGGVVVRAGLDAGDRVVVAGHAHLLDGDAVDAVSTDPEVTR